MFFGFESVIGVVHCLLFLMLVFYGLFCNEFC